MFLKDLTLLSGVSGCEYEVRNYIKEKLEEMGCEYYIDKIGNVIAHNKGKKADKKIVVAAHMDEVGFIVSSIDGEGFIKFKNVGGIDNRVLNSKIVEIGEKKITGVIGSKAIHLMSDSERGVSLPAERMYIDIGSTSRENTESKVSIGDYVTFKSDYVEFGDNMVKAKALDDRAGCAAILELLKMKLDVDFYGCFTVMEEVGLIGANVIADQLNPDYAVILEGTVCADMPEVKEYSKVTEIGKGPAISVMDAATIYKEEDIKFVVDLAKKNDIPCQFRLGSAGGNDSGAIHKDKAGCRVIAMAIPCKYIHSPINVASIDDYENLIKLTQEVIENL